MMPNMSALPVSGVVSMDSARLTLWSRNSAIFGSPKPMRISEAGEMLTEAPAAARMSISSGEVLMAWMTCRPLKT